jgi:predicted transcriptional regulator
MYARKYIPITHHTDPSYTITAEQATNLKASINEAAQAFDKHIDKVGEYLTFRTMHQLGVI